MLDLKAKLLQAGLVTEDQVQKVESEEALAKERKAARKQQAGRKAKGGRGGGRTQAAGGAGDDERWQRRIAELKEAPKSEQYETIRGWVQRTRLDQAKGLPSDEADRFHFTKHDGHISWLTLEPDAKSALSEGKAGIIAFMSHNGLTHCVVPSDVARDVGAVRPEWVRHLDGFEVETRAPEAPATSDEITATEAEARGDDAGGGDDSASGDDSGRAPSAG